MERLDYAFEAKFAGDASTGAFEGYASVFGGMDSYGDTIAPGAFTRTLASLKAQGRTLPMYFNHGAMLGADARPVGVWSTVEEDGAGLKVSGRLVGLDTETGKFNHALMKEGAMRGLSIGFSVPSGGATYGKGPGEPKRTLKQINLREISVVDVPADANARITSLKSAAEAIRTIREFEDFLRDEGGFSHAAAKAIAAGGFKSLDPRDEDDDAALRTLAARIKALAA